MLGRNPGYVTTQGQIVADLFADNGYSVVSASSRIGRAARLAEMVRTVVGRRREIDILVIEVYSGLSFVMADVVSLFGKGIPMIGVLHGGNLPNFTSRYPRWTGRVLRRFNRLVAPSAFLAREIGRRGFDVGTIPNVVDVEKYPLRAREQIGPKFLWMRSFHPDYNPAMALRVLEIVRRSYPEATMVMAGVDKGLEPEMKRSAAAMGLDTVVRFPGFLDEQAKIREFSAADIYLNTNRVDNTPVSVIEACAMGLPVIATNVGGISDLISDGVDGLLVSEDNAQEMADAAVRLLRDPNLAKQLSNNGRRLAERSSWPVVKGEWERTFVEVIGGHDTAVIRASTELI